MALTKTHIIDKIGLKNGFSKTRSAEIYEHLMKIMKNTLASGEDIMICRFGKFCVKTKEERKGRNPATGSAMLIRPRKVVLFKCSKKMKAKVNKNRK